MTTTPDALTTDPIQAGILGIGGFDTKRAVGYVGTSAASTVAVRATAYTPQSSGAARFIKSTSASDAGAGTGAQKVKITYYTLAGGVVSGPFVTEITLNGTTEVSTANGTPAASDIALIEKMEVSAVGSGGGNVGTIQLLATSGGAVMASIAAGDNQTYWCHHYVPTGKTAYITELRVAGKNIAGTATLNVINPGDGAIPQKNLDTSLGYGSESLVVPFLGPLPVPGPAIIFLNSRPDAATASTTHAAMGWFEK